MKIPPDSIVFSAEKELSILMNPATTPEEIQERIQEYEAKQKKISDCLKAIPAVLRKNKQCEPVRLKKLEQKIYACLILYARFCLLTDNPQQLIQQLDNLEQPLRGNEKKYTEERIVLQKLKVFLIALKTHVLVFKKESPTVIMASILHFMAEMENYRNAATLQYSIPVITLAKQEEVKNTLDASSLWDKPTTRMMGAFMSYARRQEDFSKADKDFINYFEFCLNQEIMNQSCDQMGIEPPPRMSTLELLKPLELMKFDFNGFKKRLHASTVKTVLSQKTEIDESLIQDGLLLGKLIFLKFQLSGILFTLTKKKEQPRKRIFNRVR
jgi:hypothetical protein